MEEGHLAGGEEERVRSDPPGLARLLGQWAVGGAVGRTIVESIPDQDFPNGRTPTCVSLILRQLARSRASATGSPSRPLRRLWLRTAVIVTRPLASVQEHHREDEELGGRGEPEDPQAGLRLLFRVFRVQFL